MLSPATLSALIALASLLGGGVMGAILAVGLMAGDLRRLEREIAALRATFEATRLPRPRVTREREAA
ncbi:hypothetical protein [Methylobacterium sp. WSM2598]|uniref:hypothetical protein n=1 Tax=Methylobacterium sp. WSM2598 TaxID=398261 RepID=UPI000368A595|nr:hypothetical protein [Methylobacterium sp. WSM2598]